MACLLYTSYKDEEGLINAINSKLNKEFGYGKIAFSWDDTNKQVTLKSSEHKVGFTDANLTTGIASDLGFSEKDNVYDGSTELSSCLLYTSIYGAGNS